MARADRATATYAVGATDLFTNAHVTDADNAAVALRLLGRHDRLVWYVPDLRDVPAGDAGSVRAQLPAGLVPALWLVAAAVLAMILWRGRRLGPLVVEPLGGGQSHRVDAGPRPALPPGAGPRARRPASLPDRHRAPAHRTPPPPPGT